MGYSQKQKGLALSGRGEKRERELQVARNWFCKHKLVLQAQRCLEHLTQDETILTPFVRWRHEQYKGDTAIFGSGGGGYLP